MQHQQQNYLGN